MRSDGGRMRHVSSDNGEVGGEGEGAGEGERCGDVGRSWESKQSIDAGEICM